MLIIILFETLAIESTLLFSVIPIFAFVSFVFLSRRMTLHAVLEIRDTFLDVLRTDFGFLVFMATVTGIGCKRAWVTSGA